MSVPIEYLRRRVRPKISIVAGSALRNGGYENLLEIVFDDCHANDGIRDCERAVVGSRCGSKYHELPRLPAAASRIPTAIIATAPGRHSPKEVVSASALIGGIHVGCCGGDRRRHGRYPKRRELSCAE